MTTETIFRHLGRNNESYTGIGPGRTREEYLNLFSRASYSSKNEWPYSSPLAGFYDIGNTSTNLILLNQRHKFSRLRGEILPKTIGRSSDDKNKTIFEQLLELEEKPKSKQTHKVLSPRIPVDPYRHFETRPRTAVSLNMRRNRSLSNSRRAQSASVTRENLDEDSQFDSQFARSLQQYYKYIVKDFRRPKVGLQQYDIKEPTNRLLRQSGIYICPGLSRGQKLYLKEKCRVYDIDDSRTRLRNSYLDALTNRFATDFLYKPEYRLNDPKDYFNYKKYMKTPRPTARPLNTGYFSSRRLHQPRQPSSYKTQNMKNTRSNTYLDSKDVSFGQKSSKDARIRSAHRKSASTTSTNSDSVVNVRFHQEAKQVPKISVRSTKTEIKPENHDEDI